MKPERFWIAPDIARALRSARPVVALETTVVTHGLPSPRGVEVAHAMEEAVTAGGSRPATIGLLDGRVHIGLDAAELDRLASTAGVAKVNLSNFAAVLAAGAAGSTTVAATMLAAHLAGIGVFATGGIGGVHRGAAESDDVSADLGALARWPVTVVCSGAKSILDLPRTLERLETLGVPVFGWRCDHFPAFWRRSSGLPVDWRFDDFGALAGAIHAHHALRTGTGIVVANPVPAAAEMEESAHEQALAGALGSVRERGIRGRAVTPALLEHVQKSTGGRGVETNIALLRGNAALAGELAAALAR